MKLVSCIPSFVLPRAAVLALALCAGMAHADQYSAVEKLIQSGQSALALEQLDAKIKDAPRDPQWRFLQGVAHMNEGHAAQATATFEKLVQEYPELPEPYNNLAVIYARQGDLDRARSALEAAVRNNPNYAVAHENLGDIYARLAYQSYAQSLAKGGRPAALNPKLKQLKDMLQPAASVAAPATGPAAVQPTQPAQR